MKTIAKDRETIAKPPKAAIWTMRKIRKVSTEKWWFALNLLLVRQLISIERRIQLLLV